MLKKWPKLVRIVANIRVNIILDDKMLQYYYKCSYSILVQQIICLCFAILFKHCSNTVM